MLPTILQFIAAADPRGAARRVRRTMMEFTIAAVCLAIGLGFLMAGIFMVAAARYGATYTAFGFAGVFLAVAAIVMIVHRITAQAAERRRAERMRAEQMSSMASAAALALLPTLLKGRGLMALAVPALAVVAFAVARELKPRDGEPGDDLD